VAELVPVEEDYPRRFVPLKKFKEWEGILSPEEGRKWIEEIHQIRRESGPARDPFEKYEEQEEERRREGSGDR
jgi:hypothetical protein